MNSRATLYWIERVKMVTSPEEREIVKQAAELAQAQIPILRAAIAEMQGTLAWHEGSLARWKAINVASATKEEPVVVQPPNPQAFRTSLRSTTLTMAAPYLAQNPNLGCEDIRALIEKEHGQRLSSSAIYRIIAQWKTGMRPKGWEEPAKAGI